ncbi:MAG: hypothetical protein ACP6IY_22090 [Promethearchaeia archaeon]
MLKEKIVVRIDAELKKYIKKLNNNSPDGISRFTRKLFLHYMKEQKFNDKINFELKQEIKDYLNKKKGLKLKKKQKERLFMYYLISNTIKSIYRLSSSFLVNSGDLNMMVVNKVIDGAIEIYNNYPEDIRNDLKNEIDNLKMLKDKDILINKMKTIRLITQQQKQKSKEEK